MVILLVKPEKVALSTLLRRNQAQQSFAKLIARSHLNGKLIVLLLAVLLGPRFLRMTKKKEERPSNKDEEMERHTKPEVCQTLFHKISGEKRLGVAKGGSRVVPYLNDKLGSDVSVSTETGDLNRNPKDCEDLSQIRKQILQIENQRSNLLELLQTFMGSSESGMHSMETCVQGLEPALDEISLDLVMSTGRMSSTFSAAMCFKLPGAEFLSSKLWKRTRGRSYTPRFSAPGKTSSAGAVSSKTGVHGDGERFNLEQGRCQLRGNHGLIVNPLAKMHCDPQGISEPSTSGVPKNCHNVVWGFIAGNVDLIEGSIRFSYQVSL